MRHKVNTFRVVDNYAEMLGVDPHVVRPDEEAEGLLRDEQQAMQQQAQADQVAQQAKAAQALAQTPMNNGSTTALDHMVQQLSGVA